MKYKVDPPFFYLDLDLFLVVNLTSLKLLGLWNFTFYIKKTQFILLQEVVICDIVVLYLVKKRRYFKSKKYEEVDPEGEGNPLMVWAFWSDQ